MEDEIVDAMGGLALIYNGKEVEGSIINYKEIADPVLKEIVFSLGNKKYRFYVEELAN